jgi:hypothetical protein
MGILGKHDKKLSWQEDSADGRKACLVQDSLLLWGPFLRLPTSVIARALGPTSTAAQDGMKPKPVGRQLGQALWNLVPTIFGPPCSLLAKTEHASRRSARDLELELTLVLTYMTPGSSISEEEGRKGELNPHLKCHAHHAVTLLQTQSISIAEIHPTWEIRYTCSHSWQKTD